MFLPVQSGSVCENQKQFFHRISGVSDCHLAFLHRFEQRALHLGGGAVPPHRQALSWRRPVLMHAEFGGSRVIYLGAYKVAGRRSGVNCNLEKSASMACETVLTNKVFARPGTPSSRIWPSANSPMRTL